MNKLSKAACLLWLGAVLVLMSSLVMAKSTANGSQYKQLEAQVLQQIEQGQTAGVSIAIVHGEQLVYQRAFGKTKRSNLTNDLTPAHLFRSASTLKMMVGTALVRLEQQGKVDLQAPIVRYISDIDKSLANITVHQLLTHTSGLLDENADNGSTAASALKNYVMRLDRRSLFLPSGTAFSYSNPGYSLAGYVIEVVSGLPFAQAMDELVFKPLQMHRSTFNTAQATELGLAYPHSGSGSGLSAMGTAQTGNGVAPSGTLFSTVGDYAQYLKAMLNEGVVDGKRVFARNTVKALGKSYIEPDNLVTSYGYSYGLMVGEYFGHRAWFHTGGMPGYKSNVLMLPDLNLGIVLFTNGGRLDRHEVLKQAVSVFAPIGSNRFKVDDPDASQRLSEAQAEAIAGTYIQRGDLPKIRIEVENGTAVLTNRNVSYVLYHHGRNKLVGVTEDGRKQLFKVSFNPAGEASHVQWWIRAFAKI